MRKTKQHTLQQIRTLFALCVKHIFVQVQTRLAFSDRKGCGDSSSNQGLHMHENTCSLSHLLSSSEQNCILCLRLKERVSLRLQL